MKALRMMAVLLCALLSAAPLAVAEAAPYRIYMALWRGVTDAERGFMAYFKEQGMAVEFIVRDAQEDKARIAAMAGEIRSLRPDLVYVFGTTLTAGLVGKASEVDPARHLTEVPVVFNIVADPVGGQLTAGLASSGRNLTGVSHLVPLTTQVSAILSLGAIRKVGAVYNPLEANSRILVEQLEQALGAAGVAFVHQPFPLHEGRPSPDAIPSVVEGLAAAGVDLVYLPSDSFVISHARAITAALLHRSLPAFSATEAPVREGEALLGIVSNYYTAGKFAGHKARQILVGGVPPASIPMERLAQYTVIVNRAAMRQLEFYPPVTVMRIADVIGGE